MMTMWDEIVGYTCLDCGQWATHWYGATPICCTCHAGDEEGGWMAQEAKKINSRFQKGLPLFEEEP